MCVGEHHTKLNPKLLSGALRRLSQFINGVNTRTKVHNIMSTFNPYFQFHVTSFHEHVYRASSINYLLLVYLVPIYIGLLLTMVYIRDLSQELYSFSFTSTIAMPISAYLLTTLVYTSLLTTQILLAPYSTAISRRSTPGVPRHGLYPSTQSSPSPCYFRENLIILHIPNFI